MSLAKKIIKQNYLFFGGGGDNCHFHGISQIFAEIVSLFKGGGGA